MPNLRKRKIDYAKNRKTYGSSKVKSGKIQKYSSCSEFESDNETSTNKINQKKQIIESKSLMKKHLITRTSSTDKSVIGQNNLKAGEGTEQLKGNGDKSSNSVDSNESPLMIDDNLDDDLTGLQKYMNESLNNDNSSLSNSKSNIPDIKSNSEDISPEKNNVKPKINKKKFKVVCVKSKYRNAVKLMKIEIHESDSDVEETQDVKKANLNKDITKGDINKELKTVSSNSESDCQEKRSTKISDFKKSLTQETIKTDNHDKKKLKITNPIVKNKKNKSVYKEKHLRTCRKITSSLSESNHEAENVSSDDMAEEEDLNEMSQNCSYSKYKPTEEERLKLANMLVVARYPILSQHKIESTAGTRTMSDNEREEFEEYIPLKHGKFSHEEDKKIKRNWKIFCQDNDWDSKNPRPFLFMKHKSKIFYLNQYNRRKFIQCLAHGLPDRCLYSVFQRFKILFEPHKTCRYESDEDRTIMEYVEDYEKKKAENKKNDINEQDRKFAELAIMLRRTRASVWRRYRVLRKKAILERKGDFCHSSK
ncbi:repetitive organellar protein-like [Phymastichus coffea]|uniref:repetitive organellar protein-like n=1 Tax=Phymastichus coffea TaxID=108790 RepID=UPI00273B7997|nr:repetitive organellar protein-like [Phymastichus coffea]XP_058790623.1 repetitive organellar protein-like [Phymastichus coffea]